jgi:hypothetical protein
MNALTGCDQTRLLHGRNLDVDKLLDYHKGLGTTVRRNKSGHVKQFDWEATPE